MTSSNLSDLLQGPILNMVTWCGGGLHQVTREDTIQSITGSMGQWPIRALDSELGSVQHWFHPWLCGEDINYPVKTYTFMNRASFFPFSRLSRYLTRKMETTWIHGFTPRLLQPKTPGVVEADSVRGLVSASSAWPCPRPCGSASHFGAPLAPALISWSVWTPEILMQDLRSVSGLFPAHVWGRGSGRTAAALEER